jgi:hypothetical protein
LVFAVEKKFVSCEVRTGSLYIVCVIRMVLLHLTKVQAYS